MTDAQVILLFAVALAILLAVLLITRRKNDAAAPAVIPDGAILIDGSNVMYWGGEPSLRVLQSVIAGLTAEGAVPFLCFDANVGYKLADRYWNSSDTARFLNLPEDQVFVVDRGVVADSVLLKLATEHELQVVTNDRFRDWSVQYPWVKNHRRFRRGRWQHGQVIWTR